MIRSVEMSTVAVFLIAITDNPSMIPTTGATASESISRAADVTSQIANCHGNRRCEATLLNNIGTVFDEAGDYDRAESAYRKALSVTESFLREGDRDLLVVPANLLGLYVRYRQMGKAERFWQRLPIIAPRWHEARTIESARLFLLSGAVTTQLTRYSEAEPLLLQAEELFRKLEIQCDTERTVVANNLAILYRKTGRAELAISKLRQAVHSIASRSLPQVRAIALVNLALLEITAGQRREAKLHSDAAIQIAQQSISERDPALIGILTTAAEYMRHAGRSNEVKKLERRVAELQQLIMRGTSLAYTVDYGGSRMPRASADCADASGRPSSERERSIE